jgi:hypothetical protein
VAGSDPDGRPVDCSATPSYSMKWRSHADHEQKHETGDWMHSELDNRGPITEAAEPKVQLSDAPAGRAAAMSRYRRLPRLERWGWRGARGADGWSTSRGWRSVTVSWRSSSARKVITRDSSPSCVLLLSARDRDHGRRPDRSAAPNRGTFPALEDGWLHDPKL